MKVGINFNSTLDEDGIDCYSSSTCHDLYDLAEVSRFLTSAIQGAGWNYVVDVGIEKDDGEIVFGNN